MRNSVPREGVQSVLNVRQGRHDGAGELLALAGHRQSATCPGEQRRACTARSCEVTGGMLETYAIAENISV
jgi:hypothetical protein